MTITQLCVAIVITVSVFFISGIFGYFVCFVSKSGTEYFAIPSWLVTTIALTSCIVYILISKGLI